MLFQRLASLATRNAALRRLMSTEAGTVGSDPGANAIKRWKLLTFFVALPGVFMCYLNAFVVNPDDHHARPEFKEYEYLHRRTKMFPWGDGNHSLIHNKHVNALPEGYEETDDGH